ncbi:hypothetical protein IAR55_002143 [Kwoniella newhampshirensis]|uniref:SWR1-complex protein 5 n=1 Tax=Kwoniella newhampshirensis TaxID=1651941 RepID=A0AAW0YS00_9TREE
MSTLLTADLASDESDGDFVPTGPKTKSKPKPKGKKRPREGSHSSSATTTSSDSEIGSDDDEFQKEKAKLDQDGDEVEERRRRAREEYERLKAEMAGPSTSSDGGGKKEGDQMVEIRRARRFAGKTIYETVKLPASDPEVVAYLARQAEPHATETVGDDPSASTVPPPSTQGNTHLTALDYGQSPSASIPSTVVRKPEIIAPRPKGPPPRRKPRQSLEQMSAALDKGKKMTTLEKSQMDWKSHTSSSTNLSDELAANRRNGGFLDKQDFLDRVGERRAGAFGTGNGTGRGGAGGRR